MSTSSKRSSKVSRCSKNCARHAAPAPRCLSSLAVSVCSGNGDSRILLLSLEPHDEPRRISMSCPICERRPPKRFCPAKGEKICAICCGREREVTIDCPSGCPYLVTARRYETEHRKPISFKEFPYPDVEFLPEFVHERWTVVSGLATAILAFQIESQELNDGAVL